MKNILIILVILISLTAIGQGLSIPEIKAEVEKIDHNPNLQHFNFDANEVYHQTTDGGGTFEIWLAGNEIRKISQNIFLSNGQFITTLYLKNNQPILIIETEKHYEWKEDLSVPDQSKDLKPGYEEILYTYNWDEDPIKVETTGESRRTEIICGLSDYWGMLDAARKILAGN